MMKTLTLFLALLVFLPRVSHCAEADPALQFRPLTEKETAGIRHNAALVQERMGPLSKVDFSNFSEESIEWLDGFIERNRKNGPTEKLEQVIAAYVGEAIRVNFKCEWVGVNEGIGLQCPGEVTVLPLNKVSKQFESGHEHSVYDFYRLVPTLIKEARERQQGSTK